MQAVTVKSTKQDILKAYEELAQQLTTPVSPTKTDKSTPASAISKVIASLSDFQKSISDLIPSLEKEQLAQQSEVIKTQDKLNAFHRDLSRTEEELRYKLKKDQTEKVDELESSLKAQKAQFDADLAKKLADLSTRESKLEESEKELKELRDDAKVAPARVAMELKKAVEEARAQEQQTAKHASELLAKDHEGTLNLANQKIATLEKQVTEQANEITSLKSAYDHAAEQMKAMAVSVISASRPLPAPPAPVKE
ncbi:hypothetical protein COU89_02950 [Candidatus Roizmanbacteria bacterium CG10_big_fil_rev_8_21_14_0_10_45_7]|uniref:Uncharacterized protein n=1 Tax=Candidatus Roizmanbacteria bacterium CG10_big_fil_rev_8_21_14_0_10_45_7 TaxID=1974854 RepID=A0A2M8KUH1_9BACT|nr:MAG: hypothetical protein COU89_02950 [Candidatus Roizmanbacteria bacterium CG10_big_fil_rev_8_21_14_0_10_45_7]